MRTGLGVLLAVAASLAIAGGAVATSDSGLDFEDGHTTA